MIIEPKYLERKFTCPHCGVVSKQDWMYKKTLERLPIRIIRHRFLNYRRNFSDYEQTAVERFIEHVEKNFDDDINTLIPHSFSIVTCQNCDDYSLWVDYDIVYPIQAPVEKPNDDLNEEIKEIYIEASKIFYLSPKGATALLRLALQKLLKQIGKDGKNINNDIKELVADGLNKKIQKALDLLRVIGNNAVHPGLIDLDDNSEAALKMFSIINIIADELITKPKELDSMYDDIIPEETKKHIEERDK